MRDWTEDREMLRRVEVITRAMPRYVVGNYLTLTDSELNILLRYIETTEDHIETLQAKIDALMLEYCPDDMTPEQRKQWGNSQRSVEDIYRIDPRDLVD